MNFKKYSIIVIVAGLFIYAFFLSFKIYNVQKQIQIHKYDFAEMNKVNYGLFNLQLWKIKAFNVFDRHIQEFDISPNAYKEAEKELNKYLTNVYYKYIDSGSIFNQIFEDAEKNKSINKVLLKLLKDNLKTQISQLNIKEYLPSMAHNLAIELKNNQPRFRKIMQSELVKLMNYDDKYSYKDPRIELFKSYGCNDITCTNKKLNQKLQDLKAFQMNDLYTLGFSLIFTCFLLGVCYNILGFKIYTSGLTIISIILLLLGVSLPMIDLDARINSVVFNLYETDLSFDEQVIFYQSKSILDVTRSLIESKGVDLKIVGFLIFCFSILFPFIKLILGLLVIINKKIRNNNFCKNLIFYLGKWSMADVFVVALFMSYIGFYGLFGAQLQGLERNKGGFAIETVNYTSLSIGIIFFTAYCLLSIILGIVIQNFTKKNTDAS
jgi:DNA-binding ferritin-like protein (Dps family)